MPPAPDASIIPAAPVGLVGSILLTIVLIVAAGWLSWLFAVWSSRDLRNGKGPLFFYEGRGWSGVIPRRPR